MPKLDLSAISVKTGSSYPRSLAHKIDGRSVQPLSPAGGLTQFGANLVTLAPGALSSFRHWHEMQDEFLVVTDGRLTLIDDHGETELEPGDCAAFPAGDPNGHQLTNRTDAPGSFIVIGTHTPNEVGHYSDMDMKAVIKDGVFSFTTRDGRKIE